MRINGQSLSSRLIDLILGCLAHDIMSMATARGDLKIIIRKEVQLPLLKWSLTASREQVLDAILEIEAEEERSA